MVMPVKIATSLLVGTALLASAWAQTRPTGSPLLDQEGRSAFIRGQTEQAAARLSEATTVNPFDPVALNNLAVLQASQGDYQGALSTLERANRLAPGRRDIMNNLLNLQTWLTQDSQFPLTSRTQNPLMLPRAEDTPPDIPGLWQPLVPAITPPAPAALVTPSQDSQKARATSSQKMAPSKERKRSVRQQQPAVAR